MKSHYLTMVCNQSTLCIKVQKRTNNKQINKQAKKTKNKLNEQRGQTKGQIYTPQRYLE